MPEPPPLVESFRFRAPSWPSAIVLECSLGRPRPGTNSVYVDTGYLREWCPGAQVPDDFPHVSGYFRVASVSEDAAGEVFILHDECHRHPPRPL